MTLRSLLEKARQWRARRAAETQERDLYIDQPEDGPYVRIAKRLNREERRRQERKDRQP